MMNDKFYRITALDLAAKFRYKDITVSEAVLNYIDTIEKNNKQNNNFITITKDKALNRAKEIQSCIDNKEPLTLLSGVCVGLSDNIVTKDITTSCASKMLENYKPVFNATIVEKLESADLIIIGKTNMDEFALGKTSDSETSSATAAPAAIANGEVPLALGTDIGGNLRQACSSNGITCIKPTYGSVSRYGVIASASSLEQVSVMGKSIEDCAVLLSIISGPDNKDSTCIIKKPFEFNKSNIDLSGLKIGLPKNYFAITDDDVKESVLAAAKVFVTAGASLEEFEMPLMEYAVPVHRIISSAELSSNLSKFDGLKFGYRSEEAKTLSQTYKLSRSQGFGYNVKKTIMLGSYVLSSGNYDIWYKKALRARTLIKDAYNKLFEKFDIILSPVKPSVTKNFNADIFTAAVNLAGLPAFVLPCCSNKQDSPIGFQMIGKAFTEDKLLYTARVYQFHTDYHKGRRS